jgi:hypothetical protein
MGEGTRSMTVGGQKPTRGVGCNMEGPPTAGDPPHNIMGVWLL